MLILKQNAANTVPTPPSGKGTIFLDDSDVLSVKTSDGNVETFPTVAAANSQVVFINGTALSGENGLTYDFNNNVLNVDGNVTATNVKTDNLLYANGQPWDLSDPGGSNTQIQFNDDESFGGSAAFTFDKTTNVVAITNVLLAGANASASDFANTTLVVSKGDTGVTDSSKQALLGEALAASVDAIGIQGVGKASGSYKGTGIQGTGKVTNSADTGAAVGLRGYATDTHSGGYNIGVLGNAAGSGLGNYAFYVQAGNIGSIESDTAWDLNDNSANALAFNSSGKANILRISTVDGSEGVAMSGTLSVTGNANAGNIGAAAGVFTANVTAANIYANTGIIGAQTLKGEGGNISNIQGANVSGAVSSATTAGTVTTAAQPNITSVGTLSSATVTGNVVAGNVYANSGTIGAATLKGEGGNISNIQGANVSGTVSSATTAGTVTTAAQPNITSVGTLSSLSVTGNANVGNIGAAAGVFTGNISSLNANLGNLVVANVANLVDLNVSGNANIGGGSGGNISGANNIAANTFTGTLTTAAQPNITSVGTLSSLAVTANGTFGNVYANSGTIGASLLTGTLTTAAQPNVTSVGTLTSLTVTGTTTAGNLSTGGTLSVTGNANVGNLGTAGLITATGNVSGGNLTTGGALSVTGNANVGNIGAAAGVFTANVSANNITTTNKITAGVGLQVTTGALDVLAGNLNVTGNINVTGNLNYSNVTDLVVGDPLIYIGANNTGDTVDLGIVGSYNNGTYYHTGIARNAANDYWTFFDGVVAEPTTVVDWANATYPTVKLGNLIATGTANITGNANVGNIGATNGVFTNVSGNGSALSSLTGGNVTGQVGNALVAGTVYTAAQPNITSVGTLTSLTVTGNVSAGNVSGTLLAGTLTTAAQPNITSVGTLTGLDVNGNITAANITANTGSFTGNGAGLSSLNASNISSGTLAQARLANSSLTVNGTSISLGGSATITAVNPSALTLGSYLTGTSYDGSAAVTAAVDATSANTASKVVARDASGNFSAGTITATLSGAATTAGTVTTAAQPNITSVGTLSSLAVTGNITAGNVSVSTGTVTLGTLTTGANTTAGTVTGNWTLSAGSRWNATYADLAEIYAADAEYVPGTVLLFGGDAEVTISNAKDSTRVAGVVSTDPAYVMNAECQGEHKAILALQGRVPCKVHGPVRKGDLMVSAENGHAVANNEAKAGTIIGKALENFDGESGVIEVVVGRF